MKTAVKGRKWEIRLIREMNGPRHPPATLFPPHHVVLPSRDTLRYRPCLQTGIKTRAVHTKAQLHCLIVPGYHLTLCIK